MSATLYERLGGGDAIYQLVCDAVDLHLANPLVATRFEASEDIEHAKRMGADFFSAGAGGPEEYHGNILEAMDKHGHGDDLKAEVLAILYSLKGQVIRV